MMDHCFLGTNDDNHEFPVCCCIISLSLTDKNIEYQYTFFNHSKFYKQCETDLTGLILYFSAASLLLCQFH